MTNPFENADGGYFVLVNDEGQHSLWPEFAPIPDGWTVTFGIASRQSCLDHVNAVWTDLRPKSVVQQR